MEMKKKEKETVDVFSFFVILWLLVALQAFVYIFIHQMLTERWLYTRHL